MKSRKVSGEPGIHYSDDEEPTCMELMIAIIEDKTDTPDKNLMCFAEKYAEFLAEDEAAKIRHPIIYLLSRNVIGFNPHARINDWSNEGLLEVAIRNDKIKIAEFLMKKDANTEYSLLAASYARNGLTAVAMIELLDSKTINAALMQPLDNSEKISLLSCFSPNDNAFSALLEKASVNTINDCIIKRIPIATIFIVTFYTSALEGVLSNASYNNINKLFDICTPENIDKSTKLMRAPAKHWLSINKKISPSEKIRLTTRHSQHLILANDSISKNPDAYLQAINSNINYMSKNQFYNHDYWINLLIKALNDKSTKDSSTSLIQQLETVLLAKIKFSNNAKAIDDALKPIKTLSLKTQDEIKLNLQVRYLAQSKESKELNTVSSNHTISSLLSFPFSHSAMVLNHDGLDTASDAIIEHKKIPAESKKIQKPITEKATPHKNQRITDIDNGIELQTYAALFPASPSTVETNEPISEQPNTIAFSL